MSLWQVLLLVLPAIINCAASPALGGVIASRADSGGQSAFSFANHTALPNVTEVLQVATPVYFPGGTANEHGCVYTQQLVHYTFIDFSTPFNGRQRTYIQALFQVFLCFSSNLTSRSLYMSLALPSV